MFYTLKKKLTLVLLFLAFQLSAQHFTHDFGIHAGVASIQTDYGVREDFLSNYGNVSGSISFTHTLHFFNRDPRWNSNHRFWSYVALRTELNLIPNGNFRHYGEFAEKNSPDGEQLRAMTGKTSITNLGVQLEYYFKCLRDFVHPLSNIKFNPYILGGIQYTLFNSKMSSELGDWTQNPNVLPTKWRPANATDVGPGSTYAITFGGGVRYNLTKKIDLNAQFNWQFFFSDSVDGLTANVNENLNNEWLLNFQLGIIFHLNFSSPLSLF